MIFFTGFIMTDLLVFISNNILFDVFNVLLLMKTINYGINTILGILKEKNNELSRCYRDIAIY